MAKQFFPLLPKLKENSAVNPDKASVWEEEHLDFLNALVKSLAVSGTIKDVGHIDSIPDVWARPLLFQMALFDAQNTASSEFVSGLHDRVVGEWRALLAMLALKEIRHLNLRAEAVDLTSEDARSGLGDVLRTLAPVETIDPGENGADWTFLYVLFFNEVPIAITSPTTLVSAAADYMTAFRGGLPQPWSTDGVMLTDPVPYLTGEELNALAVWLSRLHDDIQALQRGGYDDNQARESLLRCIVEYQQTIRLRLHGAESTAKLRVPGDLEMANKSIFRLLNRFVETKPATAESSAVRLVPSPSRKPAHDVLITSPSMARDFASQVGVQAPQLVVWPGISANDITEASLTGDRNMIGAASLGKTEWFRPEEFFTERMTVMEPGKILLASLEIEGMEMLANDDLTPVPPIRPELLEYLTPEDIASRLSIEDKPDKIVVRFLFPLSGVDGMPSDYRFTKEYPKEELIYLDTNVPVLEIWPNFRREGWNKYYLYYENSEAQNTGSDTLGKNFFYVDPWSYGKKIAADIPEHGLANRFTTRMTDFPEALIVTVLPSQDGAYAQPVETGVFLLKAPPLVNKQPDLSWQLGIDFGTSSTMIFYREGNHDPKPLSFEPHLYQVTDSGAARTRTFINFIPSTFDDQDTQAGSFLSIFHILDASRLQDEIRPLQDGHVFWLNTKNTEAFREEQQRIDANLKWKDDATGRRKVATYIKQICLQSLVEAAVRGVEKIKWNFSFPTAFSQEQQFAFRQTCEEAVAESYEGAGFQAAEQGNLLEPWPESKASAYHFNKLGHSDTNFSEGAICLDIGAGTTDISIVSGQPGKIVYHTSIQFAGRYLFHPIYAHYDYFAKDVPDLTDVDFEKKCAIIDADMREHSEDYLRQLKNITGREDVRKVLQDTQFATAGIFYYLGEILKELKAKGIYAEDHVPDVFVGGNGSRIFSWITGGAFASDSPFLLVLKHMLIHASGLAEDSQFDIKLSERPKIEVAAGMIERRPHNDEEFFDEAAQTKKLFGDHVDEYIASSVLSGDAYEEAGAEKPGSAFLSAYDIAKGITVQRLDMLKDFVKEFNNDLHIWSDGVEISEDDARDIQKRVNSYYVSEKDKDVKKIYVEPVFIMGLRKTVEKLVNENDG